MSSRGSPTGAEKVAAVQLEKFHTFLEEFGKQLLDIEDALDENLSDSWGLLADPVALEVWLGGDGLAIAVDSPIAS